MICFPSPRSNAQGGVAGSSACAHARAHVPRKATDPTALEAMHHPLDEDEIGVLLPPLPIRRR